MTLVGRIESLWRYPVKSMRGETLEEAFIGFGGLRGDRVFAIHNARARQDFPYFTARERGELLLCRPAYQGGSETNLQVETWSGEKFAVTDPHLLGVLAADLPSRFELSLLRSEQALTDSMPVSLISLQTVRQLTRELGTEVDTRRFRANIYIDFGPERPGFYEDQLVGRNLKIGPGVVLSVVERDVRCKMIALDPDTSAPNAELMKLVARSHESRVGVYAKVLAEGPVRPGDSVELID